MFDSYTADKASEEEPEDYEDFSGATEVDR